MRLSHRAAHRAALPAPRTARTRPRTRFRLRLRWPDIAAAGLTGAATVALVAAVFERIPA